MNLKTIPIYISVFLLANSIIAQNKCDDQLELFANKLCTLVDMNYGRDDAAKSIEMIFITYAEVSKESPNYKEEITAFWNANNVCFICKNESIIDESLRTPQHFLKRVVDLNMEPTVFEQFILTDSEELPIDVNAVEMVDGKGETFLDYLNLIINDPSRHHNYRLTVIKDLRDYIIEEYGAKTAAELEAEGN